jgi:pimeloyl-ACP methyl ester carboxylesterase
MRKKSVETLGRRADVSCRDGSTGSPLVQNPRAFQAEAAMAVGICGRAVRCRAHIALPAPEGQSSCAHSDGEKAMAISSTGTRTAILTLAALFATACDRQPGVNQPVAEAAASGPASGSVASADGTKIAYESVGKGDTALVFIHGWSCDRSYWKPQPPAFAGDYRVVTLDLAGHGASAVRPRDWSIAAFGEDVAAVVRALPERRVILVGHSMGGPVAVEAARLSPGRVIGLVGVDTFSDLAGSAFDPAFIETFKKDLRRDFAGTTRNFVSGNFFPKDADPALKERIVADMASAPPPVAIASMDALLAYDLKAGAAALKVPITTINSDLQPPMNEAAARKTVPRFRLVTIKGVGHFPQLEAPDRFNSTLRAELERIARS